jgi:hypothetical protein
MQTAFVTTGREQQLASLRLSLDLMRLADLRQAARRWGWTVRGNGKAEVIDQMVAYLTDVPRIRAAITSLPAMEQEILTWSLVLTGPATSERIRLALQLAGGHDLQPAQLNDALADLQARALLTRSEYGYLQAPAIFQEWLPKLATPGLAAGPVTLPANGSDAEQLAGEIDSLLSFVDRDKPHLATVSPPPPPAVPSRRSMPEPQPGLEPRVGLLPGGTLRNWGYAALEDQERVQFLLQLLIAGGVCQVNRQTKRVETVSQGVARWQDLSPDQRRIYLVTWSLVPRQDTLELPEGLGWDMLDRALGKIHGYGLRQPVAWYQSRFMLMQSVAAASYFLLAVIQQLQPDVWYRHDRFEDLIYRIQRDLLNVVHNAQTWRWFQGATILEPAQMSLEVWRATYGELIQAWSSGPARWLGLVHVAEEQGRVVAIRIPEPVQAEPGSLPSDTVRFQGDEIVLRNLWQAAGLRRQIERFTVQINRTRTTTLYRLDARTFRAALQDGVSADSIIADFASSGFALPPKVEERLRGWQASTQASQLYDEVAVIDLADDLALPELQVSLAGMRDKIYVAAPRCLVVLDSSLVPGILNELRRKGYTPRLEGAQ